MMARRATELLILVLAICTILFGCGRSRNNTVVAFLDGADRQAETIEQRLEIKRALTDMLNLPPEQLRNQRYADYQMKQDSWTAPELLYAYFVPRTPMELEAEAFYRDIAEPRARAVVQKRLREIESAIDSEMRESEKSGVKGGQ